MFNQGIGGVDLVDQRTAAYHLDRKPSIRFYLRIFFDLVDVACVNAFIVYNMMHQGDFILLDYKTIDLTHLICRYTSRSKAPPEQKARSNRKRKYHFEPTICHRISLNLNTAENVMNTATKKDLTEKLS